MLQSESSYEPITTEIGDLDNQARVAIKEVIEDKMPRRLESTMTPHYSRFPQFYGLPKDHKPGLPLRPVVSSCGGPTSNISLLLERILNQLLPFVPAHIESTQACIELLRPHRSLPANCIVASLDVVSLYSNIPIDESVEVAVAKLEEHQDEVDMLGLEVDDVRQLLSYVLSNNCFEFDEKRYRQRKGIAMGNHLAPPLAIIFMSRLEEEAFKASEIRPDFYRRYIDDSLLLWMHGLARLREFVSFLNSRHESIAFTLEHSAETASNSINFLDLTISVQQDVLQWELFVKPSHSGVHLSYCSALPEVVKKSVAINQFRRAAQNSSTPEAAARSQSKIHALLKGNDYPQSVIAEAMHMASLSLKAQGTRDRKIKKKRKEGGAIVKLPFVNDQLSRDLSRVVRRYRKDVRIVFSSSGSLKSLLVSSSSSKPVCPREKQRRKVKKGRGRPMECRACDAGMKAGQCVAKGVVYSLLCSQCGEEYVGETERPVRERMTEHYRDAKLLLAKSPWGSHYRERHQQDTSQRDFQPFQQARVIGRATSRIDRRLLEATEIRRRQPRINQDSGWKLTD